MKVLKQIMLAVVVGMLIVVGWYALGDTQAEDPEVVACEIAREMKEPKYYQGRKLGAYYGKDVLNPETCKYGN